MKKRILMSVLVIAVTAVMVASATTSYFSDTEASVGNSLTAGTLDLLIDGKDENVIKFNKTNLAPKSQPLGSYLLTNNGSISGYLNITEINVRNLENELTEPEREAGDETADVGELGDVLNILLFLDYDGDGWKTGDDKLLYNGPISNLPSSLIFNEKLAPGASVRVSAVISWWESAKDNLAQSDTVEFDFVFHLNQVSLNAAE